MNVFRLLPDSWKQTLRRRAGVVTQHDRLHNLRRAGFAPGHILDGGAYRGEWAAMARAIFPDAFLLLVEPQPALTGPLQALCRDLGRARVVPAALGRAEGQGTLLLQATNSRMVGGSTGHPPSPDTTPVSVATLDSLLSAGGFTSNCLVKLDLQGHEMEALAGAGGWFGRCEAILMEVSWLRIGEVPLVGEVLPAMDERGYVPYDLFGQNYRPRDRALWQTDILFLRRDSELIQSLAWA